MTDFKDRMIEAIERGETTEENAYDYVREATADAADARRKELREAASQMVAARDAGDVCGICGQVVTWVDHLPPRDANSAVQCFVNVRSLRQDIIIDDIFPRV